MPFRSRKLTSLLAACVAVSAAAVGATLIGEPTAVAGKNTKLFVWYEIKADCPVYPNYPKAGVKGQKLGWEVEKGQSIIWRYNVNSTWALVSDPGRAKDRDFPWWGFVERKCIGLSKEQTNYPEGEPIPDRLLEGRSKVADDGFRVVDYNQGPETVVKTGVRVKNNATLRDRANFVVGNVFAEWKVDVTNLKRSNGHWVYVYSPSARKWGYIEARKLDM